MDDVLRRRLLDDSKAMLTESRQALSRFQARLDECIVDTDGDGKVHPLRKQFQHKVLGLSVIRHAYDAFETRKRNGPEAELKPEHELVDDALETSSGSISVDDRSAANASIGFDPARIAEEEERLRQEIERAETIRLEAEKMEQRRLEAQKSLEEERAALERIAREKEELRRKLELEQQELQRFELERKQAEEKRQAQLREEEERKAKEEVAALELRRIEQERLIAMKEYEDKKRQEEERLERERLEREEQERLAREEQERLETERLEKERQEADRAEQERIAAAAEALEGEDAANPSEEDEAERALQEALAEKAVLEQSMMSELDVDIEDVHNAEEVEEEGAKGNASEHNAEASANEAPSSFSEKKYVTMKSEMLQPTKGIFGSSNKSRILVLREDKFRYFDKNGKKMLGGLDLSEEGVEVILTAVKKSPSGLSLRFISPRVGTLEFFPDDEKTGRAWIKAVEHNLEMRYELPDLGPEEALTYYDYLGVQPELADSSTILQAYAEKTRGLRDEALKKKLNEALQILNDPFKKVEYDNYVTVQRQYRFGSPATVQIKTPRGECTDIVLSRVFTDATFSFLYWQDIKAGPALTGRHLCVELLRIQEVQAGSTSNAVNLVLNNGEILIFTFNEKREAEDFGAAVRFAKSPQLSSAKRRQNILETSV